jgi:hypothetical protein
MDTIEKTERTYYVVEVLDRRSDRWKSATFVISTLEAAELAFKRFSPKTHAPKRLLKVVEVETRERTVTETVVAP